MQTRLFQLKHSKFPIFRGHFWTWKIQGFTPPPTGNKSKIPKKWLFGGPSISTYSTDNVFGAFWSKNVLVTLREFDVWRNFLTKMTPFWRFFTKLAYFRALKPLFIQLMNRNYHGYSFSSLLKQISYFKNDVILTYDVIFY